MDIQILMLVLLVDLVVVLVDIQAVDLHHIMVEIALVNHTQETLLILLPQMDGDMMVVEVILLQFSKVLAEVVLPLRECSVLVCGCRRSMNKSGTAISGASSHIMLHRRVDFCLRLGIRWPSMIRCGRPT